MVEFSALEHPWGRVCVRVLQCACSVRARARVCVCVRKGVVYGARKRSTKYTFEHDQGEQFRWRPPNKRQNAHKCKKQHTLNE